jgi:hypothetical protein
MVLIKESCDLRRKNETMMRKVGKVEINYIQPSKSMIERTKVRIEPTNMGINKKSQQIYFKQQRWENQRGCERKLDRLIVNSQNFDQNFWVRSSPLSTTKM